MLFLVTFDCFCEFLYLFFCTHVTCDPFSPLNPQIFRMVGKKAARKTCSKWRTQTPLGLSSNIRTVERKSVVWLFWFRNYLATVVKRVPIIWTLNFSVFHFCVDHAISTGNLISKLVLNVEYLLLLSFFNCDWVLQFGAHSRYRGSPLSTNSLSTIPEVVRFINSTKSANSPK